MIYQSFLLGNLVSVCIKILNSVVVVGLYYGFLTTLSIGPSYLFLLRAQVMEEGTEEHVAATTGFSLGQLMMFISIYYAPLHLALGRPHTITVLALPYLLVHFFWNNHKHYFDYGSTTRNSIRDFRIQCVFLNNFIFQFFNHFILPSSMLARLVNIEMFRCNNKMLFVTSSFVGWLIGHFLFLKWLGLVLVWLRENHSIRSNKYIRSKKYIRSNKYLVAEWSYSMARIFSILLLSTCGYYLARMPSPLVTSTHKLQENNKQRLDRLREEREASKMKLTRPNQKHKPKRSLDPSFLKKKYSFWKEQEKPLLHLLFDSNRWNQPHKQKQEGSIEVSPSNKDFTFIVPKKLVVEFWKKERVEKEIDKFFKNKEDAEFWKEFWKEYVAAVLNQDRAKLDRKLFIPFRKEGSVWKDLAEFCKEEAEFWKQELAELRQEGIVDWWNKEYEIPPPVMDSLLMDRVIMDHFSYFIKKIKEQNEDID